MSKPDRRALICLKLSRAQRRSPGWIAPSPRCHRRRSDLVLGEPTLSMRTTCGGAAGIQISQGIKKVTLCTSRAMIRTFGQTRGQSGPRYRAPPHSIWCRLCHSLRPGLRPSRQENRGMLPHGAKALRHYACALQLQPNATRRHIDTGRKPKPGCADLIEWNSTPREWRQ